MMSAKKYKEQMVSGTKMTKGKKRGMADKKKSRIADGVQRNQQDKRIRQCQKEINQDKKNQTEKNKR